MSRNGWISLFIVSALSGLIGFKLDSWIKESKPPLVHQLKAPLMLAGGEKTNHQYLLPAGTSLYFDRAYPEGFVRYKVYVNVEGVSLDVAPAKDKFWIDPLVAFPVKNPLSKEGSHDISALRAKVQISGLFRAGTWEAFGTPEYKGGVPGPTDIETLIAEFVLDEAAVAEAQKLPLAGETFVVPEAPRPWLSADFKKMLESVKNSTVHMGQKFGCKRYETSLVESKRSVTGFECLSSNRMLLYLTLSTQQ